MDGLDFEWITNLLYYGFLRGGFNHLELIWSLLDLTRYWKPLTDERIREANRLYEIDR